MRAGDAKLGTDWYVLDRAVCYRIIRAFPSLNRNSAWEAVLWAEEYERLHDPTRVDEPVIPLRRQWKLRSIPCTCAAQIVGSAWHQERCALRDARLDRRANAGVCKRCGGPVDERTPGCPTCQHRHWRRANPNTRPR